MKWLSLSGERLQDCINKVLMHLNEISFATSKLKDMYNALIRVDREAALRVYEEVDRAEKRADELKRKVIYDINVSFIDARDREDIYILVNNLEDVISYVKSSAKVMLIMTILKLRVDGALSKLIEDAIGKSINAVNGMVELVKMIGEDYREIISRTEQIEKIEEEVDEIRFNVLEQIYMKCMEKIDAQCMLVRDLIEDLEKISDKCEDVGDVIKLISLTK